MVYAAVKIYYAVAKATSVAVVSYILLSPTIMKIVDAKIVDNG